MYVIRLSLKKFSLRKVHHLTSFVIARPSLFYMCLGFLSASALLAANNIYLYISIYQSLHFQYYCMQVIMLLSSRMDRLAPERPTAWALLTSESS